VLVLGEYAEDAPASVGRRTALDCYRNPGLLPVGSPPPSGQVPNGLMPGLQVSVQKTTSVFVYAATEVPTAAGRASWKYRLDYSSTNQPRVTE